MRSKVKGHPKIKALKALLAYCYAAGACSTGIIYQKWSIFIYI